MVSCIRHKPKNPSPFFSVLDWLRILCSRCFGKIDQFKRPLLPGNPNGKLNWKMDNLILQNCLRESLHSSMDRPPLFGAADTPTAFAKNDEVIGDDDDETEESEGMFHGHFLLGSRVLTEVELQSPVEESRVLATPIRTPRRSNNSSCASSTKELYSSSSKIWALDGRSNASSLASSTRELHPGSSQVCALDSDSSSSLDVSAVHSPLRDAEASLSASKNVLSTHGEDDESLTGPYRRSCRSEVTCRAAPLYKLHKDRGLSDSSLTGDLDSNSLLRESRGLLKADKVNPFSDDKQSRKKIQAKAGAALECNLDDAPLKGGNITRHFDWQAARRHTLLQDEQDRVPVGSLPDCTSSDFLVESLENKSNGRRLRTRSLTDQDFTELKGCIDLGFVFPPDHLPDLRETLPALEVCYAVAHGAISPVSNVEDFKSLSPGGSPPISPWRIASPGDQPQQVKARLRHWAQAVACNVRHPCNVSIN